MVERFLHPEPDTIDSAEKSKSPKGFLTHSPPLIDRFHFIDPHYRVGTYIDDEEIDKHNLLTIYIFNYYKNMNLVTAHIDFLLDDVKSDAEFHEGGQVNWVKVFASMSQMRERISHILWVPILDVWLWHNQNCTIQFNWFRDREIPGKPLCHGKIMVT